MAIFIGHNAYQGTNALKICRSKAAAVEELRNRGCKRDDARAAVKNATSREWGHVCAYADKYGSPIEVSNRPDVA